jgi:periplasmic protein TonB
LRSKLNTEIVNEPSIECKKIKGLVSVVKNTRKFLLAIKFEEKIEAMSTSSFCISQRQKERQGLKKLLATGFVGSLLIHSGIAFALAQIESKPLKETEKPIELIMVEAPKPKPKPQPKIEPPKPEPPQQVKKIEPPKPVPTPPKPTPAPPTPQATAPSKSPTPNKPAAPPTPLTSVTGDPNLYSTVRDTAGGSSELRAGFATGSSLPESDRGIEDGISGGTGNAVAANNVAPSLPQAATGGIECVENCEPEYPDALEGAEGDAGIRVTIDGEGTVTAASIDRPNSNNQINREALAAAQVMKFSPPDGNKSVYAVIKVNFTVAGSDFDRQARERQEQASKDKEQQEAARQQQEQERQARQARLEEERQERARLEQLERERQAELERQPQSQPTQPEIPLQPEPTTPSTPENTQEQREAEILQQFRQRMENYQQQEPK